MPNYNKPIRFVGLKGIISKWRELKHYPEGRVVIYAYKDTDHISVSFGVVPSALKDSVSYLIEQVRLQLRPYDPQKPLTLQEVKDLILKYI